MLFCSEGRAEDTDLRVTRVHIAIPEHLKGETEEEKFLASYKCLVLEMNQIKTEQERRY